jgi:peptidyl-prolyl cis-trans isomerase A (cyclophilin A)
VVKGPVINSGKHYFNSLCFNSTLGEFCMNLMPEYAPNTVANFLSYLNEGLYDGVMFNSAISSARVETGYFYADPAGSPVPQKAPVANEFGLSNQRGTVALVHPEGKPDEGTSGWIVNLANNSGFYDPASADDKDFAYSVFGEVISGLNVLTRSSFADKLYLQDNLGEKFFSVPVLRNGFSSPEEAAQAVEDGDYQFDSLKSNDLYRITSHFYRDVFVPDLSPEELQAETENACVADWVESINPETVCVSTNMGEFCMELLPEAAPATVKNFLHYIADGDYKNTLIHRSVANFVIQGGGYMLNKIGNAVPQDNPVQNEFSVSNTRGTVAMARLSGAVNSATSEWFVNLTDNSSPLDVTDEGFTVFARVIGDGMQVVDAIAGLGIFDFSFLNSAFSSLPVTEFDPAKGLDVNKLVIVNDIYMPGIPDHGCFASRTSALSTYRNNVFTVPTRIGDRIYKLEFGLLTFSPEIIFSVNTSNIQSQVDRGQETASFDWATGELVIPTLKVDSSILRNVRFRLSNADTLEFTYVDRDD